MPPGVQRRCIKNMCTHTVLWVGIYSSLRADTVDLNAQVLFVCVGICAFKK